MEIQNLEPDKQMDFDQFSEWLNSKAEGRRVWHCGYLPIDRNPSEEKTEAQNAQASYINDYAKFVLSRHAEGLITLTQQKVSKNLYLYYAERRSI